MALTKQQFSGFIKQFNFRELFNEMGWNNDKTIQPISVDNITFSLQAVAEKSGFKILLCNPIPNGLIPDYNTRKKIETKVTKLFQEHLIIFFDSKKQEQIWQLVVRQAGKPTKVTETRFHISQDPELLYQRASGIFFEMDEEEKITIVDVTNRMAQNFHANADKITKQFYDKFKKEHTSFLDFIKGIDEKVNKDWYASLMLNRLMFCYFIQKKGFLDNNKNYLRDRLKACQIKKGQNKFYSFYRDFLLVLFHQGLNEINQKDEIKIEIGKIPYLNGGLFDEHELEKMYKSIDIEDKAFERIFDFFDQYEWHLDTRVTASGKDINPDVIGYIFEKYINDRADMGAYYTKEDITDYISKNSILPYLFDETKRQYPKAFASDGEIWQAVKQSNDNYIYDAVKKGIEETLPEEISVGINDVGKRTEWNKPAPASLALPTEIWREVVDRRNRYAEIKTKIDNGEITNINDFITWNLNIRQFAQDCVENTADPEFLRHFYKAISSVTILDPTCGSGAFLFAAMNILEPLYEACINRMRAFVEDEDRENETHKSTFNNKYKYFRSVLEEIQNEHHPNLCYFIYKSIILRNLYGVDIMKEAVEIAKLRLFLKLVATVEVNYRKPNLGLEPLPDIDFNIRSGNTLVGFANWNELLDITQGAYKPAILKIEDGLDKCKLAYHSFQTAGIENDSSIKEAKELLKTELIKVNNELNIFLAKLYRINPINESLYNNWILTYQPFHWFAEFYEIIHDKGGFDVVIGNPPYVVYSSKGFAYNLKNYNTLQCANLFAFCSERSFSILNSSGKFGMIIPNSSISAEKMLPLQKIFTKNKVCWITNYAWRPAKLFEGANMLLAIVICSKSNETRLFSSKYHRWYNDYRESLFENIHYWNITNFYIDGSLPKVTSDSIFSIYNKIKSVSESSSIQKHFLNHNTNYYFYYFRAVLYWLKILESEPVYLEDGKQITTGEMKKVFVTDEFKKYSLIAFLSSTLYYIHYITWSSCQVINSRDFDISLNFDKLSKHELECLCTLGKQLQSDIQSNSKIQKRNYSNKDRTFVMDKQYFFVRQSKSIIDEIDTVLAKHYGFTDEELDFIINYDIKYRMGKELEGEDED